MKSMKYMGGGARKYNNGGGKKVDYNKMSYNEAKALRNARAKANNQNQSTFTFNGKTYNVADVPAQIYAHPESRYGKEKAERDAKIAKKNNKYQPPKPNKNHVFGKDKAADQRENDIRSNYITETGMFSSATTESKKRAAKASLDNNLKNRRNQDVRNSLENKPAPSPKNQTKPGEKGKPKAVEPSKPKSNPPSKPRSKTTRELWEEKTGTDWSKAKERGLTDGSAKSNLELRKALESGRDFKAAPKKIEQKRDKFVSEDGKSLVNPNKPKAELQIRKPESKIPEMEPSKEVSFDSPSKMTTRKGQRLEKKADRIAGRKIKRAEAKEGREMVRAARKMKRGGRR